MERKHEWAGKYLCYKIYSSTPVSDKSTSVLFQKFPTVNGSIIFPEGLIRFLLTKLSEFIYNYARRIIRFKFLRKFERLHIFFFLRSRNIRRL